MRSDSMNSLKLNESFKSLTRKDAEKALERELSRLLLTAPPGHKQVSDTFGTLGIIPTQVCPMRQVSDLFAVSDTIPSRLVICFSI